MAFWNRKKKRKEVEVQEHSVIEEVAQIEEKEPENSELSAPADVGDLEQDEFVSLNDQDRKRFVQECCESITEIDHQIDEAKKEYEKVTSRLTDIQRIDRIEGDERESLEEICKRIIRLTQERNQYQNRSLSITEAQIRRLDRYADTLDLEVRKMYDAETYQRAIESDLGHLEKEKKKLHKEQREIVERQNSLKDMAKVLVLLIVSLFVLFAVIYYALEVDMTYPYLGTILLAAISSTVIFAESNRNRRSVVLAGRKINKAISLLNRVKIKYINNRNVIDYNREKFHVRSAADFEKQWIEYRRAKEYERKFQENTEQLIRQQEHLLDQLRDIQISEPDLWLSQTLAIIDQREMVEIRHALNVQRGKLRERISYNEEAKQNMVARIDQVIAEYPGMKEEIIKIVKKYLTD
ncbi:MAG: hypothetical protein Q4D32_01540 [Eubacteriales bacterium]|nr:hypothetical protein [Eubacteriales bacterium]